MPGVAASPRRPGTNASRKDGGDRSESLVRDEGVLKGIIRGMYIVNRQDHESLLSFPGCCGSSQIRPQGCSHQSSQAFLQSGLRPILMELQETRNVIAERSEAPLRRKGSASQRRLFDARVHCNDQMVIGRGQSAQCRQNSRQYQTLGIPGDRLAPRQQASCGKLPYPAHVTNSASIKLFRQSLHPTLAKPSVSQALSHFTPLR